jgi:hypothetical protein
MLEYVVAAPIIKKLYEDGTLGEILANTKDILISATPDYVIDLAKDVGKETGVVFLAEKVRGAISMSSKILPEIFQDLR